MVHLMPEISRAEKWRWDNPVLQRELLVQLRQPRSFVVLGAYLLALMALIWVAWPVEVSAALLDPDAGQRIVQLLFFGQFVVMVLLVPTLAAGAISGEKERKTYELLLTTPLRPSSILFGKFSGGLTQLLILLQSALPLIVLCMPLGGVSLYEAMAINSAILCSGIAFGMIALTCSTFFARTAAALLVSYLIVLPIAAAEVWFWLSWTRQLSELRLQITLFLLPVLTVQVSGVLWFVACRRLLYPPDVGSEGQEVQSNDDGEMPPRSPLLVLRRTHFPDYLIAPAKRDDLLPDHSNPVYDKEMRSEVFSQGTLMLRIVIQLSLVIGCFLMIACLFVVPMWAPWYVCYVVLFTMLVGPVFSASSITSERERETLELLLTTVLTPWQILWGKYLAAFRVTTMLTLLLVYLMLLSWLVSTFLREQWFALICFLAIIFMAASTTVLTGMFCSVGCRRTVQSLTCSYLVLGVLFCGPTAAVWFCEAFVPHTIWSELAQASRVFSPAEAAFAVPMDLRIYWLGPRTGNWTLVTGYFVTQLLLNLGGFVVLTQWFRYRWRSFGLSQQT